MIISTGFRNDVGRAERRSLVDQRDFRAHGALAPPGSFARGESRHQLRAVVGEKSLAGGVDRGAGIDTDVGKGGAQRRVAADVIQVPVRIDDGGDGLILLAGEIENFLRVLLVPSGVEDDQTFRRRDDDAVAVRLAVRRAFRL